MRKATIHLPLLLVLMLLAACGETKRNTTTIRHGDTCYRGETKNGKPNGYGVLTIGDSIAYSGQWKDGKREGYGSVTDSLGRQIAAQWQADTITTATRRDTDGVYHGEMDRRLRASGHGTWTGDDGTYYAGHWQQDKRDGIGCGIERSGKARAGDWLGGKYRGERMLHTSDRIYGIDVSRHQHEKGKKKYSIDWQKARITGIGSNGKGMGSIDYPITFVYIKSTEGTSVRNKYYLADYLGARRNGIHAGAYHFYSSSSAAAAQAHYFLKHSRFSTGDMPPVLDLEPTDEQIRKMGGTAAMFRGVRQWLAIVKRATGMKPVLYVGQGFVNKYLPQAPDIRDSYPVWIARYGQYRPEIRLAFWQLTPNGRVRGIHGEVDINVFNGYNEQFKEFMQRTR